MVKNPPTSAEDTGSIPELERSGEGNGNPLWYSCLGNPMDRRAWGLQSLGSQRVRHDLAIVFSVAQSCLNLCDSRHCSPPGSSVHRGSPGKNTGVGCHALLDLVTKQQQLISSRGEVKLLSHVQLCDPMDVACQASLSMGFPSQEYWSGSPFPWPGGLPDPGIKPGSSHCRQILYHLST